MTIFMGFALRLGIILLPFYIFFSFQSFMTFFILLLKSRVECNRVRASDSQDPTVPILEGEQPIGID